MGETAGAGFFIGISDDGDLFWGEYIFAAGGLSQGTGLGLAFTFDIAFSNANSVEDLAGPYWEIGGSIGWPNALSTGASFGWNDETGVWVATPFSWGIGTPGFEWHVYGGAMGAVEGESIW